jgi:hypothetical protein
LVSWVAGTCWAHTWTRFCCILSGGGHFFLYSRLLFCHHYYSCLFL